MTDTSTMLNGVIKSYYPVLDPVYHSTYFLVVVFGDPTINSKVVQGLNDVVAWVQQSIYGETFAHPMAEHYEWDEIYNEILVADSWAGEFDSYDLKFEDGHIQVLKIRDIVELFRPKIRFETVVQRHTERDIYDNLIVTTKGIVTQKAVYNAQELQDMPSQTFKELIGEGVREPEYRRMMTQEERSKISQQLLGMASKVLNDV